VFSIFLLSVLIVARMDLMQKYERGYTVGWRERLLESTCLPQIPFCSDIGWTQASSIWTATDRCKSVTDNTKR
jgi:hypothetical protein